MTLVRWNPWSDFDAINTEFDKLFNHGSANNRGRRVHTAPTGYRAATDVFEDDKGFVLELDLPGVKLEDIDIELHESTLTIAGERKLARDDDKQTYRRVERRHGRFERSFRLPKHVDEAGIEATMKDGVLQIRLPKVAEVQPRKITINA